MNVVTGITCSNCGAARPEKPGPCRNCGDTRRTFAAEINAEVRAVANLSAQTTRGPQTWAYVYMVTALLLTVALAVLGVLDIPGWARAVAMICVAVFIVVALFNNGSVHNVLLRIKRAYEDKPR